MTLHDPDHIPPTPGQPQGRPLASAALVLYGTLALLGLAVPPGLVNWAKDFEPSGPQRLLLSTAEAIQTFARVTGADWPYYQLRFLFEKATGKDED